MQIESIELRGFRGMDVVIPLSSPLALIVGPNNSGKSAVIDAFRTIFTAHSGKSGQRWIQPSDFTFVDQADAAPRQLSITVSISNIPPSSHGRLISILAPLTGGVGYGRLTLRSTLAPNGRPVTRFVGGDFDQMDVESIAREALQFVYLPPLRDAAGDLKPGQGNRLPDLVSAYAPPGHADRSTLESIMNSANTSFSAVPAISESTKAIQKRLSGITKNGPFAHVSDLTFSEAQYERIVATLQAVAGAKSADQLFYNGLGYNNILYISVLLAALQNDSDAAMNVLLVEEPEAHLHPQLQTLLMQYLETLTASATQVIATTHSPQFASSARVERITVMARSDASVSSTAHALRFAGLHEKQAAYLHRFLDVTKSSLLFAQGLLLVEGAAEQILLPAIADHLGHSLSEHGISVVSVDGVTFKPFLQLFSQQGLPFRCVAVSDSDPYVDEAGLFHARSATAESLLTFTHSTVHVELARQTLEWDLAWSNYSQPAALLFALAKVHPRLSADLSANMPATADLFADAFLKAVGRSKGEFAQELAAVITASPALAFTTPTYIIDSIRWVTRND